MKTLRSSMPPAVSPGLLLLLSAAAVSLALCSCTGVISGLTGETIPTVPVMRIGGTIPFQAAVADVAQAEANPTATWGLYNAGNVATAVSDAKKPSVVSSSGK